VGTLRLGASEGFPFLYRNGSLYNLQALVPVDWDASIISAKAINANGQILIDARYGERSDGDVRSVVLDPVRE
jgi:hypothetical protein